MPQLVKTISRGSALISAAHSVRARSSRWLATCLPETVGAGRIAPKLRQEGEHRLHHLGRDPRRGVVVEVIKLWSGHTITAERGNTFWRLPRKLDRGRTPLPEEAHANERKFWLTNVTERWFQYCNPLRAVPGSLLSGRDSFLGHCRTHLKWTAMIEVEGLTKLYDGFVAVNDLSFRVQPGEVLGLVGPNGAGKTTTLRCLCGIIPPTKGALRISGADLARNPIEAKRNLAFFSDEPRLFDYLTVEQHLNFTARIYGVADYQAISRPLLEELEIADKTHLLPGELSRGMKQKLAIACGLLHSPRVILFDEPLTGLDPLGIRRMKDSIRRRARDGAAILISSHLLHLLEEVCSHVLILKGGRKVVDGTLDEVTRRFAEQSADASLEEIFIRATGDGETAPPPIIPPPLPPA